MGFSIGDSFIITFSSRDPRPGRIAARRCFVLGTLVVSEMFWLKVPQLHTFVKRTILNFNEAYLSILN